MASRTRTKRRILQHADRLFLERGFNGFSYQDISGPMGIRNSAVHYHFPGKADLGVALINEYRQVLRKRTADFMESGGDPVNQLEAYVRFIRDTFGRDRAICPMGILSVDFHTMPEPMQAHARVLVEEMIEWLTRVLEVGRDAGLFFFNGPSRDKAVAVKALLQGAAQLARINGVGMIDSAARQLRRDLGRE